MNVTNEMLTEAPDERTEASQPIRIWHVDDHEILRQTIAEFVGEIEPRFRFEREFPSPEGLLDALAAGNPPDVLLLDVQMGRYNGLDSIRPVKRLVPDIRILMLSTLATPEIKRRAKLEGASDFLLKSSSAEQLRDRIIEAMLREPSLPSELECLERPADQTGNPRKYQEPVDKGTFGTGLMRGVVFLRSILGSGLTKSAEH